MDINQIMKDKPLVHDMADCKEIFGSTRRVISHQAAVHDGDIEDAEARLQRFAPYIAAAFPETAKSGGIIESELTEIPRMKERLVKMTDKFDGRPSSSATAICRSPARSRRAAASMRSIKFAKKLRSKRVCCI